MEEHYRQGDLLFIKTNGIPDKLRRRENRVIQEGELTGHNHKLIGGDVFEDEAGNVFLSVPEGGQVVHEEHGPIDLEGGDYEVRRQRELSGEVID